MKDEQENLTTSFGMPVDNDLNSVTAGPKGPVLIQDVHLLDKLAHFDRERIPERVVHAKGAGAHGYFEVTHDVTQVHARQVPLRGGKADRGLRAVLHRRRREGLGGLRARPARLRGQVLHRRRQLRHGRQQHAGLLHPRPPEVPRLHSHPEAQPGDQPQGPRHVLGLPLSDPGIDPPGHDPVLGPRHPQDLPQHERLQQPYLHVVQREGRVLLGEVPLQDRAGDSELHGRRSRAHAGHRSGLRHPRPVRGDRAGRLPVLAP